MAELKIVVWVPGMQDQADQHVLLARTAALNSRWPQLLPEREYLFLQSTIAVEGSHSPPLPEKGGAVTLCSPKYCNNYSALKNMLICSIKVGFCLLQALNALQERVQNDYTIS